MATTSSTTVGGGRDCREQVSAQTLATLGELISVETDDVFFSSVMLIGRKKCDLAGIVMFLLTYTLAEACCRNEELML